MRVVDTEVYSEIVNEAFRHVPNFKMYPCKDSDGYVVLEWIHKEFRFGLTIGDSELGWWFVSKDDLTSLGGHFKDTENLRDILTWLQSYPNIPKQFRESNEKLQNN